MDTISLREASRLLGTSPARVRRALSDAQIVAVADVARGRALAIPVTCMERLGATLGTMTTTPEFGRSEAKVAAALARSPRGVVGARAVARRAAVSPTTAARMLRRLEERGVVKRDSEVEASGRAERVDVWSLDHTHPDIRRTWRDLARIRPPRHPADTSSGVPGRLAHLFWTGDVRRLHTDRDAAFIAKRLLDTQDPEGLAWGVANLPPHGWREAARLRGVSDQDRAWSERIAAASERRSRRSPGGVAGNR